MAEVRASPGDSEILLDVRNLTKYFPVTKGFVFQRTVGQVKAVDDVSFAIHRGEVLGLVGESGCGKTTVARCILKLYQSTGGTILFDGHDIENSDKKFATVFRRQVQAIFQDPYSSLNPRMTVRQTIGEPFTIHGEGRNRAAIDGHVHELLDLCGLPRMFADRYPHEMSGGQRQRVGIARALALKPRFIVCDEPVSALDVSIQAQVINLLMDLQQEFALSYLFIAHDLAVVEHISDHVAVMYLGRIVEFADKRELFANPQHPYTESLLAAVPVPDPNLSRSAQGRRKQLLQGDVPSPISRPTGCHFHTRCPYATDRCKAEDPLLKEVTDGHQVACHLR